MTLSRYSTPGRRTHEPGTMLSPPLPIELPIDFARLGALDGEREFVAIAEAASDGHFRSGRGGRKRPSATLNQRVVGSSPTGPTNSLKGLRVSTYHPQCAIAHNCPYH